MLKKIVIKLSNIFNLVFLKKKIITCDDYNSREFPGACKAWNEYFGNEYKDFFLTFPFGGCALIKKG